MDYNKNNVYVYAGVILPGAVLAVLADIAFYGKIILMRKVGFPRTVTIAALGLLLSAVSGCAPVVFTSGVTAAVVANDERSAGSLIEDQEIELKIALQITEELGGRVNVSTTSYNRRVLLTGQIPSKDTRHHVLTIAENAGNIREVIDQMEIGNPSSLTSRAADSVLTAKVKTALCRIQEEKFSCLDIKVVTEQGIVYLMGLITNKQYEITVNTVKRISGVLKVTTLFEKTQ